VANEIDEPEDLRPEEGTLCPLNDLLVYRLRGVVHDHCALLVVNFGVDTGITDQVDNPLLTLVLVEAEAGGQIPGLAVSIALERFAFTYFLLLDNNPLVDFAVALGDQVSGSLDECISGRNEEEVAP